MVYTAPWLHMNPFLGQLRETDLQGQTQKSFLTVHPHRETVTREHSYVFLDELLNYHICDRVYQGI